MTTRRTTQQQHRRSLRDRRGTTSTEFAVVAPVIFLVIFASLEISRMSLLRNLAQDAAYDAARYAMVEGATDQDAIDKANQTLAMFAAQNATVTINDGNGIDLNSQFLKVEVSIPMEDNSFFMTQFYSGHFIRESITMRMERYRGFFDGTL